MFLTNKVFRINVKSDKSGMAYGEIWFDDLNKSSTVRLTKNKNNTQVPATFEEVKAEIREIMKDKVSKMEIELSDEDYEKIDEIITSEKLTGASRTKRNNELQEQFINEKKKELVDLYVENALTGKLPLQANVIFANNLGDKFSLEMVSSPDYKKRNIHTLPNNNIVLKMGVYSFDNGEFISLKDIENYPEERISITNHMCNEMTNPKVKELIVDMVRTIVDKIVENGYTITINENGFKLQDKFARLLPRINVSEKLRAVVGDDLNIYNNFIKGTNYSEGTYQLSKEEGEKIVNIFKNFIKLSNQVPTEDLKISLNIYYKPGDKQKIVSSILNQLSEEKSLFNLPFKKHPNPSALDNPIQWIAAITPPKSPSDDPSKKYTRFFATRQDGSIAIKPAYGNEFQIDFESNVKILSNGIEKQKENNSINVETIKNTIQNEIATLTEEKIAENIIITTPPYHPTRKTPNFSYGDIRV